MYSLHYTDVKFRLHRCTVYITQMRSLHYTDVKFRLHRCTTLYGLQFTLHIYVLFIVYCTDIQIQKCTDVQMYQNLKCKMWRLDEKKLQFYSCVSVHYKYVDNTKIY